ncbi:hypothetical protein N7481_009798 [Penicillium waksmanii]|uniref:uncharacterized protein n=1 Tax=Penicillium waksmanii TaxID=69791 RepID=UPI002548D8C9|nr:uncharacterized protein N7481_009798 [Penicillium waksmanii]KAJ5976091.1 hypothetical protein N7481_009798 [Penicillium waksmanii]
MPLIGRYVSHTHANLPISLWSTISLTFALSYLQIVYAISFIARPFWSSNLDFPPFRQTIESAETFAINIILEIVPTSNYRSPAPTNFISDATSRCHPLSLNRSNPMIETSPPVVQGALVHVVPPQMPQCYPEPRISHPSPQQKEVQTETMRSTHTERFNKIGDSGNSTYGTARKVTTSTRPKLSTTLEAHRQHQATSQATQSEPVTGAHKTTAVTKQEEHEEEQLTVHIVEISQPADQALSLDISQPTAPGPVMDMPNPPMAMDTSPTDSFDGPGQLEPEIGPQSASSSRYTDNTSSLSLDAGHATKSHSTESYPGKFPVSDGMEYSNLATAEYAFRERGTTSVRPFSDY